MNRFIACLLLVVAPVTAQFQCPIGDDGFNTAGCCQPLTAPPNIPHFPTVTTDGTYGCLLDCALEAQFQTFATLGFQWINCDLAVISTTVSSPTPCGPSFSGPLVAKYSRTWLRPSVVGIQEQVWRFLVNGDMSYTLLSSCASQIPCPVPPEVAIGVPVHMVGHIDYICSPFGSPTGGAPSYRVEMSLSHLNGCISHAPYSTFPLVGPTAHTDRSYHFVAPSNFTFTPVPAPVGTGTEEAVRSSTLIWGTAAGGNVYNCHGEQEVTQWNISTLSQECFGCPSPAGALPAYAQQSLSGSVTCNGISSTFSTMPFAPAAPGGLLTLRLGHWTPTATSPTHAELCVHVGLMDYQDPCTQDGPFHVVTGVTTRFQMPGMLFGTPGTVPPPPQSAFLDLQNVKILPFYPTAPAIPSPGWGSLFVSTIVWNLNLP